MHGRWILFVLEVKRYLKALPVIVVQTLVIGLFLAGIGVFASRALYGEEAVGKIRIGVFAGEADKSTDMLLGFASSMDSLKGRVILERLSEEEARKKLGTGEIFGALLLPEGLAESILSGENKPVTVLLDNTYSKMETEIFARLADAGAALLGTAQAGIYAADAFCLENGRADLIPASEAWLNQEYLNLAMGRYALFKEREVNAMKGMAVTDYYGIALFLAFLSFAGLSFGKYMQVEAGEREKMLKARGVGAGMRYLIETSAFALVFSLLGVIFGMPLFLLLAKNTASLFAPSAYWLGAILLWAAMGCFLRGLFQLTGNHGGGLGMGFTVLVGMMTASGIFVPPSFLPLWTEKLGTFLPYKGWMDALASLLKGRMDVPIFAGAVFWGLFFLISGAGLAMAGQRGYGRRERLR